MTDEREARPRIPVRDKRFASKGSDDAGSGVEENVAPEPPVDASEIQKLADDRLDQLMRMKADFENFRKRELREKTEIVERASLRIVERLLPVLDDLERALEAAKKHDGADSIVRGIELVHKHLHEVLVEEGLERVEAAGAFDPHQHEAVSSVAGPVNEPTVLEVVRPGYTLKGKTIRPALVHVTVPDGEPQSPDAEPPEEGGE